jgi:pilus assembly protein FimV
VKFRHNMLWIGCLTAVTHACALTLGPTQGHVVLGAPLDVRITIEPDAEHTLETSCIDAQALFGATLAHTTLELMPPNTVRIRSRKAVNEPLVHLRITAGCDGRSERSYTLLADPPERLATAPTQPAAQPAPTAPPRPRAHAAPQPTATPKAPAPQKTRSAAAAPLANPENMRPVLRMDTLFLFPDADGNDTPRSPRTPDSTIDLPATAPEDAPHMPSEPLQQLERQLAALVQQQQQDHALMVRLSAQLAQRESTQAPAAWWLYVLGGLLLLALGTIALLLHRLRTAQARAWGDWSDSMRQAQTTPNAALKKNIAATATWASENTEKSSKKQSEFSPSSFPSDTDLWTQAETTVVPPALQPLQAPPSATDLRKANAFVLPVATNTKTSSEGDSAKAPVSAYSTITSQDFLNAQEQAEFFASIGEYDEAIALLETHIAEVGPISPLPYLKLLEFFYQLSRSEPFEQTRQALQEHFNINVPVLSHYHEPGVDLLDGYPQLLEPIEAQWPSDAVLALLEHLLHYPVQGNFDVPVPRLAPAAFRDVLLLHSMALNTPASSRGSMERRHSTVAQAVPPAALNAVVPPASLPSDSPVSDPATATDANAALLATLDLNFELPEAPASSPALAADGTPDANAQVPALAPHLEDLQLDWDLPAADPSATGQPPAQTPATPEAPLLDLNLDGLQLDPPTEPRPPRQP